MDSLKSKLETAEKMVESQKVVKAKYHDAIDEQGSIEPKIDLIVDKTKVLLSQVSLLYFYNFVFVGAVISYICYILLLNIQSV